MNILAWKSEDDLRKILLFPALEQLVIQVANYRWTWRSRQDTRGLTDQVQPCEARQTWDENAPNGDAFISQVILAKAEDYLTVCGIGARIAKQ